MYIYIVCIYIFKGIRGSILALGLPYTYVCLVFHSHAEPETLALHTNTKHTYHTQTTHKLSLARCGIEHGQSAWESSTLPTEPLGARENTYLF